MNALQRIVIMSWPNSEMIRGLRRFVEQHHLHWQFELQPPHDQMLSALEADPPDGMLAYLGTPFYAEWAAAQPFPVINHSNALERSPLPRVCVDDGQAAAVAAEHLLAYGHRALAYLGHELPRFSRLRGEGFVQAAASEGIEVPCCWIREPLTPARRKRSLRVDTQIKRFLETLPEPCGLFVCNDPLGFRVLELARELGREVPDSLAVLGMDNDPLSLLSFPALSSVKTPLERVAYEAAALLHVRLQGGEVPMETLLAVDSIEVRESTDALAVEDPVLRKALRYIRSSFNQMLQVEDIARHAGVNRRSLEQRFRKARLRSPSRELKRVRMEYAKRMLRESDWSIEEIAHAAGFQDLPWFVTTFRQGEGLTPGAYRQQRQL